MLQRQPLTFFYNYWAAGKNEALLDLMSARDKHIISAFVVGNKCARNIKRKPLFYKWIKDFTTPNPYIVKAARNQQGRFSSYTT